MAGPDNTLAVAIILLIVLGFAIYVFFHWHSLPNPGPDHSLRQLSDSLWKFERLWLDQIYLMRAAMIENISGYAGAGITRDRLLANAAQMGRNLGSIYGSQAGQKYADLLKQQVSKGLEVVTAVRQGKSDLAAQLFSQWKALGSQISAFLSQTISGLDKAKLESYWDDYLDATMAEAVHTVRQDSLLSMSSFDNVRKHVLEFADYLEEAISADRKGKSLLDVTFA